MAGQWGHRKKTCGAYGGPRQPGWGGEERNLTPRGRKACDPGGAQTLQAARVPRTDQLPPPRLPGDTGGSGPRAGRVTRTGWGRRWRLRFGDRLSPRDGFSLLRKENNEVHGVGLRNKQLEGFRNETVSPRGQAARPRPGTWAPRSSLASVHEATLLFVV